MNILQNESTRTMGWWDPWDIPVCAPFGILFQIILFVQITHLFVVSRIYSSKFFWVGLECGFWTSHHSGDVFFLLDTTTFYEIMNFYESVSHPSVPSLNFVFLLALPVAFSKDLMFGNCHWTCDYCITKHFHVNDEHFGHELQVMETSTAI